MTVLPLNETALQAALDRGDELYEERPDWQGKEGVEEMARREVGELISTYLREVGFSEEYRDEKPGRGTDG
jgi:hypothetical protein